MTHQVRECTNRLFVVDPSPTGIAFALKRFLGGQPTFEAQQVGQAPEPYRSMHIATRVLDMYATYARRLLFGGAVYATSHSPALQPTSRTLSSSMPSGLTT